MGFIDTMKAEGFAVETICQVLREQGVAVAARTYRAWKAPNRVFAARTVTDAVVVHAMLGLRTDAEGKPTPESLYGRRKMTAALRRRGLAVAHCTVDRLMRAQAMNGSDAAGPTASRSRARTGSEPVTGWIGTSPPWHPTGSGSRTSPTCAPGQGSPTSPSSWTSSPSGSSAGTR